LAEITAQVERISDEDGLKVMHSMLWQQVAGLTLASSWWAARRLASSCLALQTQGILHTYYLL